MMHYSWISDCIVSADAMALRRNTINDGVRFGIKRSSFFEDNL